MKNKMKKDDFGFINLEDPELKTLRSLVNVSDSELNKILFNLQNNKERVRLLDYVYQLGFPDKLIEEVLAIQNQSIPAERKRYFEKYKKIILSLKTLEHNLSVRRINPFTQFEKSPALFFGIGGGSKALCKGLPFDVLGMLLTGEKLKRELCLSECRILLANRITYTNIQKSPEFSMVSIDNVMKGEKELLQLAVNKFGFSNWKVFLQTDLEKVVGDEIKDAYEQLVKCADRTNLVGGHQ
jgi:hypothetical protein